MEWTSVLESEREEWKRHSFWAVSELTESLKDSADDQSELSATILRNFAKIKNLTTSHGYPIFPDRSVALSEALDFTLARNASYNNSIPFALSLTLFREQEQPESVQDGLLQIRNTIKDFYSPDMSPEEIDEFFSNGRIFPSSDIPMGKTAARIDFPTRHFKPNTIEDIFYSGQVQTYILPAGTKPPVIVSFGLDKLNQDSPRQNDLFLQKTFVSRMPKKSDNFSPSLGEFSNGDLRLFVNPEDYKGLKARIPTSRGKRQRAL